jgi:hypothetical protein
VLVAVVASSFSFDGADATLDATPARETVSSSCFSSAAFDCAVPFVATGLKGFVTSPDSALLQVLKEDVEEKKDFVFRVLLCFGLLLLNVFELLLLRLSTDKGARVPFPLLPFLAAAVDDEEYVAALAMLLVLSPFSPPWCWFSFSLSNEVEKDCLRLTFWEAEAISLAACLSPFERLNLSLLMGTTSPTLFVFISLRNITMTPDRDRTSERTQVTRASSLVLM